MDASDPDAGTDIRDLGPQPSEASSSPWDSNSHHYPRDAAGGAGGAGGAFASFAGEEGPCVLADTHIRRCRVCSRLHARTSSHGGRGYVEWGMIAAAAIVMAQIAWKVNKNGKMLHELKATAALRHGYDLP